MIRTYILHIYVFHTILFLFLETGTSDRCLIGIVQLLRFSGFSAPIPPFIFPLQSLYIPRPNLLKFGLENLRELGNGGNQQKEY